MHAEMTSGGQDVLQNAVKTLLANIRFSSIDDSLRTLLVTSSVPNEGKTTVAVELSRAIAQGGKTVVLVEGDLRRRSCAAALGVQSRSGIYAVLSGRAQPGQAITETPQTGLYLLDCEPHIPNPVDIISSERFASLLKALRQAYDYVIVDTPPVGTFVDAAVIARYVDGAVFVVRRDHAKRDDIVNAFEQLKKSDCRILGTVLNFADVQSNGSYYYDYYKDGSRRSHKKGGGSGAKPSAGTRFKR